LWQSNSRRGVNRQLVSIPDYFDWKQQNRVFDRFAAWNFQFFNLTGADEPERVEGLKVTADYFPMREWSLRWAAPSSRRRSSAGGTVS
jgi:putative ABC transport system permease protein